MKKIIFLFVLITSYAFSQSVNDYQYVIVPAKYDFLKSEDQYRLNTLTKLLLQKYGFKAYLTNEEIQSNVGRCNFLYANVLEKSGMFVTKVKVVLKDCKDNVIFETEFGESREKEYAVAYNEAIREAGKSFDKLNYKYTEKNNLPEVPETPIKEVVAKQDLLYSETVTVSNDTQIPNSSTTDKTEVFYFSQPTANGFQVVDTTPKIIMRLFHTSQKNVFLAEKETIKGVLISKNEQWFFEYYENGKLVSEPLKLKF